MKLFFLIFFFIVLFWGCWRYFKKKKSARISHLHFPQEWKILLSQKVPLYSRVPVEFKPQWHELILRFLHEKRFEGCAGLAVTDEMKLIIAAQACLLLLNREVPLYPKLSTILIYPHAYVAKSKVRVGFNQFVEVEDARLGESWHRDFVILAWDEIESGLAAKSTHNVVVHEFAHQLDQEDGVSDGTPFLDSRPQYEDWARVFSSEYQTLRSRLESESDPVLRDYGATHPAEFFAVASEAFFENSKLFKRHHPELYQVLKDYYCLDFSEF